jgi:hypothetical protein
VAEAMPVHLAREWERELVAALASVLASSPLVARIPAPGMGISAPSAVLLLTLMTPL